MATASGSGDRLRKAADYAASMCVHSPATMAGRAALHDLLTAVYEHLDMHEMQDQLMASGMLEVRDGKLARPDG